MAKTSASSTCGIDALLALDMRQRRKPVAIDGGALEIELVDACSSPAEMRFTFWLRPDRKSFASRTSSV
jgi:hypothetical protein